MEVVWTDHALYEYIQNLEYLDRKWSSSVVERFIKEVDEKLELLISNHFTFPKTGIKETQKLLVNKHVTLFYVVEGKKIVILHFWNNYQNPKNLSL